MTANMTLLSLSLKPFSLFKEWYEEASKKELNDPNAMNLATISKDLKPQSRMVLLKNFDDRGFVFYTNTKSNKGISLENNPHVALNFHWKSLLKQIRIEGQVKKVSDKEADEYFDTRPEESKIAAWSSNQSSVLINREELNKNIKFYKDKFKNKKIPRPPHWSGYIVEPYLMEFWQDMPFRLHDRLEFKKVNNKWTSKKLFP